MAKRRRRAKDLLYIHVQVGAQHKANLKALAQANDLTVGETVERLVIRAVTRAARRRTVSPATTG